MPRHRPILHAGTQKIITTTLQSLLNQQTKHLAKQGLLFPRTDREPFSHPTMHTFFAPTLVMARQGIAEMHRAMTGQLKAFVLGDDGRKHALGSRLREEFPARFAWHNETLFNIYGVPCAITHGRHGDRAGRGVRAGGGGRAGPGHGRPRWAFRGPARHEG